MIIEPKWIEEAKEEYRGFTYLVLACCNQGYRCGYVQIPEGHPYYENREFTKFNVGYEINWGMTFSGRLKGQTGWWIGFDCHHINNGVDTKLIYDNYPAEEAEQILDDLEELYYEDFYKYAPSKTDVERDCMGIIDELLDGRILLSKD